MNALCRYYARYYHHYYSVLRGAAAAALQRGSHRRLRALHTFLAYHYAPGAVSELSGRRNRRFLRRIHTRLPGHSGRGVSPDSMPRSFLITNRRYKCDIGEHRDAVTIKGETDSSFVLFAHARVVVNLQCLRLIRFLARFREVSGMSCNCCWRRCYTVCVCLCVFGLCDSNVVYKLGYHKLLLSDSLPIEPPSAEKPSVFAPGMGVMLLCVVSVPSTPALS